MLAPLSVLTALRFFENPRLELPSWAGRLALLTPAMLIVAVPMAVYFACHEKNLPWQRPQFIVGILVFAVLFIASRKWTVIRCLQGAFLLTMINFGLVVATVSTIEMNLKSSEPLKLLGQAVKREYRPGDTVAVWGNFPQGLPFYCAPVINATNLPCLGGTALNKVPFEFPGNLDRFGSRALRSQKDFNRLLTNNAPVLVVAFQGVYEEKKKYLPGQNFQKIATIGRWEIFRNFPVQ